MDYVEDHWVSSVVVLLFVCIPLALMWVYALIDIFLHPGLSIMSRVIWLLVVLLIPLLGALVYILFRPKRDEGAAYVATTAPLAPSAADQAAKAEDMGDSGT
jgi:hypothetical protein